MEIKTQLYRETVQAELGNPQTQTFLQILPPILMAMREAAFASFPDPDAALARGQQIRADVVERLPELLEAFEAKARANGTKVFWARTAREANDYILKLAKEKGVGHVTKGKSMITEELGLNDVLTAGGIEVWESDLGEVINQLLDRPPFHLVGPAINIPLEVIRDVFMEKLGMTEPTLETTELGHAARTFLREKFRTLEMGITGVNMAVADTGTIINVENEGNIRLTKSAPKVQVSVMSLEKVVPDMDAAFHLLRLLCRSCTGQSLGAYITMDSGPRKSDELDGPEELHIVILDNGRSKIYQDPDAREALRCIRCGACQNFCPIYQKIGGYPYGWVYAGPIGQVLNPLLLGLAVTEDLFQACTQCGKCRDICPGGVDHPGLLLRYRAKQVKKDPAFGGTGVSTVETALMKLYALAGSHPGIWLALKKGGRRVANRRARDGRISEGPDALRGWFQCRDLPAFPAKSFRERWRELEKEI